MKNLAVGLSVWAALSVLVPALASSSTEPTVGQVEETRIIGSQAQNTDINAPTQVALAPTVAAPDAGKLKLSDDQLEKINALRTRLADAAGPKRLELKKQKRSLRDLITQPTIDRSKVSEVQNKINSLHDDLSNMVLSFKVDSADVLSEDQRAELRHKYLRHQITPKHHGHHLGHDGGLKSS